MAIFSSIVNHSVIYLLKKYLHKKFRLFIGDLGIGIYESLDDFYRTNYENFERRFGPAWDELKAVDIAFAPGVSSKRFNGIDEEEARGIGLRKALTIAQEAGGAVICRSGRTKAFFGYQKNEWVTKRMFNLEEFPGTQLEVYLE